MKKLFVFTINLLVLGNIVCAQTLTFKVSSNELLEKSVSGAIYWIRSEYQLREKATGDLYGLGGNDYFGREYAIGIAMPQGIVVNSEIMTPWEHDSLYARYKDQERFEPILSKEFMIRPISNEMGNSTIKTSDLAYDSSFVILHPKMKNTPTIQTASVLEDNTSGWIIWYYINDGEMLTDSSYIEMSAISSSVKPTPNGVEVNGIYASNRRVMGGVFIVAKHQSPGEILLQVAGILRQTEDNKWLLVSIPSVKKESKEKAGVSAQPEKRTLPEPLVPTKIVTPIGKKKVKKQ